MIFGAMPIDVSVLLRALHRIEGLTNAGRRYWFRRVCGSERNSIVLTYGFL